MKLVLWTQMSSILENVPHALEKMCIFLLQGIMFCLYLLILSDITLSFKVNVSLLIFYPDNLFIFINGVLKFPTILYHVLSIYVH